MADNNKIADDQTKWALERTRLAKERTFTAWMRTGLGSMAVGLGLVKLLPDVEPMWIIKVIGVLLVCNSIAVISVGYRTYEQVLEKLDREGYKGISAWTMRAVTAVLLIAGILALILIFTE